MIDERTSGVKGAAGIATWGRLLDDAFVRLWWTGADSVTVEFDADHQVRERLLDLLRARRRCDRALRWRVRRRGPHLRLRVDGPGAADTVTALIAAAGTGAA